MAFIIHYTFNMLFNDTTSLISNAHTSIFLSISPCSAALLTFNGDTPPTGLPPLHVQSILKPEDWVRMAAGPTSPFLLMGTISISSVSQVPASMAWEANFCGYSLNYCISHTHPCVIYWTCVNCKQYGNLLRSPLLRSKVTLVGIGPMAQGPCR